MFIEHQGDIIMTELHDNIEKVEPSEIIPYSNNPKSHPEEQVDKIASSIKNYGFVQPIVVDQDNEVIIGHGRLQAAKKLDLEKVPVIKHEDLTESEIKALRLADNRIAESEWEDEKLAVELEQLTESDDYEELIHGFNEDEMSEYLDSLTNEEDLEEPDTEDPEQVETDIQEGEVFKLGEHRLMCGDATNEEHVETLMDGENMDLILTDPPYGIDIVDNQGNIGGVNMAEAGTYHKVEGDKTDFDPSFLLQYDTKTMIFGGNYFTDVLPQRPHWIVWDKDNNDNNFSDCELLWTNIDRYSVMNYSFTWAGMIREGDQEVEGTERSHPTQKPVGLLGDIVKDYSQQGENIVDLFAGSGSLLLAAEQTNRKAFCMELDPQYVQVIINRWEELTGKKADPIT